MKNGPYNGLRHPSRRAAEKEVGHCLPAPLGNVREPNKHDEGFKNSVILDIKSNRANEMVVLRERAVLPEESTTRSTWQCCFVGAGHLGHWCSTTRMPSTPSP